VNVHVHENDEIPLAYLHHHHQDDDDEDDDDVHGVIHVQNRL